MENKQEETKIEPGLKVHHRNPHGELIAATVFRMHSRGNTRYYEYPKFSGNLWYESNGKFTEPAGRINTKGEIDTKAEHVAYKAPATGTEVIVSENATLREKLAAYEKELKEIRREGDAKHINKEAEKMVAASAIPAATKKEEKL